MTTVTDLSVPCMTELTICDKHAARQWWHLLDENRQPIDRDARYSIAEDMTCGGIYGGGVCQGGKCRIIPGTDIFNADYVAQGEPYLDWTTVDPNAVLL